MRNPNISRLDSRIAFFGPSGHPVTLGDLVRMVPHALVALIMLWALCAWAAAQMGSRNYRPERKNELGDTLRYKSGHAGKTRYVGTRVNRGKVESKTFIGETDNVVREWEEWSHACDREPAPPTPVIPAHYRVPEEELAERISDSVRADIIELLESGEYKQVDIASACGVSAMTVTRVKKEHEEAEARRREREAARERQREERAAAVEREREERKEGMALVVPDNFMPRRVEQPRTPNTWFVIAQNGMTPTLFSDRETAERILEMLRQYDETLCVVECKTWEVVQLLRNINPSFDAGTAGTISFGTYDEGMPKDATTHPARVTIDTRGSHSLQRSTFDGLYYDVEDRGRARSAINHLGRFGSEDEARACWHSWLKGRK